MSLLTDDYESLFSLIGTTYRGDGMTTFALPDLRGRIPISRGMGSDRTPRTLGETGGAESVVLTAQHLPAHSHPLPVSSSTATSRSAVGNVRGVMPGGRKVYVVPSDPVRAEVPMLSSTATGGNQPHENRQPFLTMTYIIAWAGAYPSGS